MDQSECKLKSSTWKPTWVKMISSESSSSNSSLSILIRVFKPILIRWLFWPMKSLHLKTRLSLNSPDNWPSLIIFIFLIMVSPKTSLPKSKVSVTNFGSIIGGQHFTGISKSPDCVWKTRRPLIMASALVGRNVSLKFADIPGESGGHGVKSSEQTSLISFEISTNRMFDVRLETFVSIIFFV